LSNSVRFSVPMTFSCCDPDPVGVDLFKLP
jgi:hypothetical protein